MIRTLQTQKNSYDFKLCKPYEVEELYPSVLIFVQSNKDHSILTFLSIEYTENPKEYLWRNPPPFLNETDFILISPSLPDGYTPEEYTIEEIRKLKKMVTEFLLDPTIIFKYMVKIG